jgi:hypothetical protein
LRIVLRDVYVETSLNDSSARGALLRFMDGLTVENLHVHLTAASGDTRGIGLEALRNSDLSALRVTGSVSMGIETFGGTIDFPSMLNTRVSGIHIEKDDAFTAESGDHGVYVHGCRDCVLDGVFVVGTWALGSEYGFKFRQNLDCRVNDLYSEEVRITSDLNSWDWETERNTFTNVKCDRLVLFGGDFPTRIITETTFENVHAGELVSQDVVGPIHFRGTVDIDTVTSDENCAFNAAPVYTVATLPTAAVAAGLVYVSDEAGGAVPAFSDGTNWRRVTDRAIVS